MTLSRLYCLTHAATGQPSSDGVVLLSVVDLLPAVGPLRNAPVILEEGFDGQLATLSVVSEPSLAFAAPLTVTQMADTDGALSSPLLAVSGGEFVAAVAVDRPHCVIISMSQRLHTVILLQTAVLALCWQQGGARTPLLAITASRHGVARIHFWSPVAVSSSGIAGSPLVSPRSLLPLRGSKYDFIVFDQQTQSAAALKMVIG
jgi:hypothetical protein